MQGRPKPRSKRCQVLVTGSRCVISMELLGRIRANKEGVIKRLEDIERVFREIDEEPYKTQSLHEAHGGR